VWGISGKKRPVLPSDDGKKRQLIQACWDLDHSHTQEREVHSLLSAINELEVNRGTIITWFDEDSSNDHFEIIKAWKWLLMQ